MNKFVTMVVKQNNNWERSIKAKNLPPNYVVQYLMRGFKIFFFQPKPTTKNPCFWI